MIVIAGKNDIAVKGLLLAIKYFGVENVIAVPNQNDSSQDSWQRSFKKLAVEQGVAIKTLDDVYNIDIDIFLSLEFDKIINVERLSTNNVFNIHFSKLPMYKGMFTSVWPILFGDTEAAVTLHKVDRGIDTGDIIFQQKFDVSGSDRSLDLYIKFIKNTCELLTSNFEKIISGDITAKKQTSNGSTYYSKKSIDFNDINIDFNQTAWQVQRYVYAFSFRPYQLVSFEQMGVSDIVITPNHSTVKPGTVIDSNPEYSVVSTIDYDVKVYYDKLDSVLSNIPDMTPYDLIKLLPNIVGVNDRNDKGWSPIIVAAYHGRLDLIEYLVRSGADINDRNYKGTTVLMYAKDYALKNNDPEFLQSLIHMGADAQLKDWSGRRVHDYISGQQASYLGL